MVPPAAAYVFFPPGGEPDPTMREIYIKSIESGALDKALSGWAGDDYPTPGRESPPLQLLWRFMRLHTSFCHPEPALRLQCRRCVESCTDPTRPSSSEP